jgi:hypothetical protein
MRRQVRVVHGIVLSLFLGSCDLLHHEQRSYCGGATPEQCAARPEWCNLLGGTSCVSSNGAANYCRPDEASQTCRRDRYLEAARCPRDGRLVVAGQVADLSRFALIRKRISPFAWELSGSPIRKQDFERLTDKDRQELCGAYDEPCRLTWDEAGSRARCAVVSDPCAGVRFKSEPLRCQPKNLCSGVICP